MAASDGGGPSEGLGHATVGWDPGGWSGYYRMLCAPPVALMVWCWSGWGGLPSSVTLGSISWWEGWVLPTTPLCSPLPAALLVEACQVTTERCGSGLGGSGLSRARCPATRRAWVSGSGFQASFVLDLTHAGAGGCGLSLWLPVCCPQWGPLCWPLLSQCSLASLQVGHVVVAWACS